MALHANGSAAGSVSTMTCWSLHATQADLEQDLQSAREAVNKAEQLAGVPLTTFDSPGVRSSRCHATSTNCITSPFPRPTHSFSLDFRLAAFDGTDTRDGPPKEWLTHTVRFAVSAAGPPPGRQPPPQQHLSTPKTRTPEPSPAHPRAQALAHVSNRRVECHSFTVTVCSLPGMWSMYPEYLDASCTGACCNSSSSGYPGHRRDSSSCHPIHWR